MSNMAGFFALPTDVRLVIWRRARFEDARSLLQQHFPQPPLDHGFNYYRSKMIGLPRGKLLEACWHMGLQWCNVYTPKVTVSMWESHCRPGQVLLCIHTATISWYDEETQSFREYPIDKMPYLNVHASNTVEHLECQH